MALAAYPELMSDDRFPSDVKNRVERILNGWGGGSVGAYSNSSGKLPNSKHLIQYLGFSTLLFILIGIQVIRNDIAEFISRRDGGVPSNPDGKIYIFCFDEILSLYIYIYIIFLLKIFF